TNVVLSGANADVIASTVTTSAGGAVTLNAVNQSSITADNESAVTAAAESVGVLLAFNTIGWQAENVLFNTLDALLGLDTVTSAFGSQQPAQARAYIEDSTVQAAGDLTLTAATTATLSATVGNDATTFATSFYGASAMSAAGVLASNKVATDTEAFIDNTNPSGGPLAVDSRGSVALSATDAPSISAQTHLGVSAKVVNNLGVGLLSGLVNEILGQYQYTLDSGTQTLNFGDRVWTGTNADGSNQVYEYMGTTAPVDLGGADYADLNLFKPLNDTNIVPQSVITAALKSFKLDAGTTTSYYALVDRNDVQGNAESYVSGITLTAAGSADLTAGETAAITATDTSNVTATTSAAGGVIVTNQVQGGASAYLTGSSFTADATGAGGLSVNATNAATVSAVADTKSQANKSVGAVVAFNTVGWQADNILFQAIDALLGSDYLTHANPAAAEAYVLNSPVVVPGAITVHAADRAAIDAQVGNEQTSQATNSFVVSAKFGVSGMSAGGALASNRVAGLAYAYVQSTTGTPMALTAGGAITVTAENDSTVESISKVEISAVTTNDLSAVKTILQELTPSQYDYTTASGTQTLANGARVRDGASGAIYKFTGASGTSVDLSTDTISTDSQFTLLVQNASSDPSLLFPNIGNLTNSDARAVGVLIVYNDVRGDTQAYIDTATIAGSSLTVGAVENATIAAEAEDNVNASGGSAFGKGTVFADGGQAVTNTVLSNSQAYVTDSTVNGATGSGATGAVSVAAENTARIDATLLSSFSSAGDAIGIALAFHAGTRLTEQGQLVTAGGRVLTLVASGQTIASARARVYQEIDRVQFQGSRYRRDIAAREERP
ncbi:MAG: phosphoribosylglycinamide synthetase C domain-containing protein, partial [Mycobacteriales bacterium]